MRFVVLGLCAVGLYVSIYMQRKAMDARDGRLTDASVVQTPRARVVGGVPNSLIGICYYLALGILSFGLTEPAVYLPALIAVSLAAAMSLYLAYSLLFVTKMPCLYCWTGHIVNWALLLVLIFLR
ncbi:MAG TPA: vitamin K epoxide reductase family protein [Candidatus Eremiobacteraceae bacterium]|nr:vitamin K epoxide reductase family protein [Candidatus Eremiobacteraceae bacterium]